MNTLEIFSYLKKAGISESHSEAITNVLKESNFYCDFATKTDLKDLRYEMKCLEHRLTNKVGAIVVGTASVVILLDKYL